MILKLDPASIVIFVGTKAVATRVEDFESAVGADGRKAQQRDKTSNLPIWSVAGELIIDGEPTQVVVKVLSEEEPKLVARADHRINGALYVTPYLPDGSKRIAYSYKVVGKLVPAGNAAPESK